MAVLSNCGETGPKLAGFIRRLHSNKISTEHKNSVSEIAVAKIRSGQGSVFRLINLLSNSTRLYSHNWSSQLASFRSG